MPFSDSGSHPRTRPRRLLPLLACCAAAVFTRLSTAAGEAPAAALSALVPAVEGVVSPSSGGGSTQLRGKSTVLILPAVGSPAGVLLRAVTPGGYPDSLHYTARGEDGKPVARGACAPGKEVVVPLPTGKRCLLSLDAGRNAATLQVRNGCFGLLASPESPLRLFPRAQRLYFLVPHGVREFTLFSRGQGEKAPASVQAFTPQGRQAGTAATLPTGETALRVTVDPNEPGGIWSLETAQAEQGIPADTSLWLSPDLPPFLAESPESLAVPFLHYTATGALFLGGKDHPAILEAAISVPPQPDRLVRAVMRRAGSRRLIWATDPVPFSTEQVRIVLPERITPGEYEVETTLHENRTRLTARHVQRLVIAGRFVYPGSKRPVVDLLPPPAAPTPDATAHVRARLGLDHASAAALGLRVALYREGERQPAFQQDLGHPMTAETDLPLPRTLAEGAYRVAAELLDPQGRALHAASYRGYLHAGQLFQEAPPAPMKKAVLRASQRRRGYVLFARGYHDAFPYNYEPLREDLGRPLAVWATPGEYEPATFGVYALKPLQEARVTVNTLRRVGGGGKIAPAAVDIRLVRLRPRRIAGASARFRLEPELLEKVPAAGLPTDRISQYWLTLHVPENTPPGDYRGTVTFRAKNIRSTQLKFLVKVLPFRLVKPAARTWGLDADGGRWQAYTDAEIGQEMRDIKAHGIDSLVLHPLAHGSLRYEGGRLHADFGNLSRLLALYRKAGLRGPVVFNLQELTGTLARLQGRREPRYDAEFERLFQFVLSDLAMRAAAEEWPEIVYHFTDAADQRSSTAVAELALARKVGLKTAALVRDPETANPELDSLLDLRCYAPEYAAKDANTAAALRRRHPGKPFWWYGSGGNPGGNGPGGNLLANRYRTGVAFWRSGAAGAWSGPCRRPQGDADDAFDGTPQAAAEDAGSTYPVSGKHAGQPTLQWEGIREGIDDARYLNTCAQMVARAKRSGNARAIAYAGQVEKETAELLRRVPWGTAPAHYTGRDAQVLRTRLSKYMGTLLNKLNTGSAMKTASHRHRRRHRHR